MGTFQGSESNLDAGQRSLEHLGHTVIKLQGEHPGVSRALLWEPHHFHRALIVQMLL